MNDARPGSDDNATLSERIDSMIAECRRRGSGLRVDEIERLYTDGCAEALMLEAELRRVTRRRLALTRDDPASAWDSLSKRAERVTSELDALRSQLRQLRAALEWLQSGRLIEQQIGLAPAASPNAAGQR
ncbi:MAG: hypothetical protein LC777_06720 [Actinobacteria bacterium]|nr:hypothetical protein [Actinomycetota bacterium]